MAKQTATLLSYPAADKTKLAGVAEGAEVNVGEEFTTGEQTKLAGVAAGAEVNPADLAALDPTAGTKLAGIEEGAQVDQSGAEIKTAYEAEANAFTDTKDTKLSGIDAGAEVNPADLADLDSAAATKLGGIEDGAKDDQTGAEMVTAIVAVPEADRQVVVTDPAATEHKIYAVHRNAAGELEYDYEDVAEA